MPAFVPSVFKPGRVGVISRSGSLGTLVCLNLTRAGLGQSAFIGIGGDPMLGTTTRDALEALDEDAGTDAVVIVGEIGGGMEEDGRRICAQGCASRWSPSSPAPPRRRARKWATPAPSSPAMPAATPAKRKALEAAGVVVVDTPSQIAPAVAAGLGTPAKQATRA